jgi:hypothetical protein
MNYNELRKKAAIMHECRRNLHFNNIITDAENDKIRKRIRDFQKQLDKVEIKYYNLSLNRLKLN